MQTTYLTCAETAKLIRAALKRSFPGIKFGVRSHVYAGGASINIDWFDGPTQTMVSAVSGSFCGGRFDGSIDMAYHVDHWMMPDGSVIVARNPGSAGSGGYDSGERNEMPAPDARLVQFGANHIFTQRRLSRGFLAQVLARVARKYGSEVIQGVAVKVSDHDGAAHIDRDPHVASMGCYLGELVRRETARLMIVTA